MRILRPFSAYVAKFTIWPEEAIYLLRHAGPKCLPNIAAAEIPHNATQLMILRGDVARTHQLITTFRDRIDLNWIFCTAAVCKQFDVMNLLLSDNSISLDTINLALERSVLNVQIESVRFLLNRGGKVTRRARQFIIDGDVTELTFAILGNLYIPTPDISLNNTDWGENKTQLMVRAIQAGHMTMFKEMQLQGFKHARALIVQAIILNMISVVRWVLKLSKRHICHVVDALYLAGNSNTLSELIKTIIATKNLEFAKRSVEINLPFINTKDETQLANNLSLLLEQKWISARRLLLGRRYGFNERTMNIVLAVTKKYLHN